MNTGPQLPLIKVVGVSASGKSTLVTELRQRGYNARPSSQEHSQTPDMWRRIRPPAILIFLDATLENQKERRSDVDWSRESLAQESKRLEDARGHADLLIDTSDLTPEEVAAQVLSYLGEHEVAHAGGALPPVPGTGGRFQDGGSGPAS